ncbi:MAG: diaminopimelate epimerase [Candidatus Omnitrophica bacterium]|nr:diaminopimelate epimerase [Candidatus Omnitrophota bacterium]
MKFHKMVASGNDFLVIDNRKHMIKNPKRFAEEVCRPHFGVGSDGVLLIEPSRKSDFLMRIINADGSEAEACGNGYRCVGLYAHTLLGLPKAMRVETLSGEVQIDVRQDKIKVKMVQPTEYREKVEISDVNGQTLHGAFVNTGVPHAVIFVEDLETIAVETLGRIIRHHDIYAPRGVNVDFVQWNGKNELSIRTYERGVEKETLACGTGAVAAAVVAHLTDRVEVPVHVKTRSGETLNVYFERANNQVKNVFLEGGARFVFEGRLSNSGD